MTQDVGALHVMQAVQTLDRAGAQEVVRLLAKHMRAAGCTVTVCSFENGPMRAELEKLGIPVETLSRPRHSVVCLPLFLLDLLRLRRDWARLIEAYRVDVLQTHLLQVLDFVALSLRGTTCLRAVFWTVQNVQFLPGPEAREPDWLYKLKAAGYVLLYRWLSKRVDGVIAVSDGVRQAFIRQVGPVVDRVHTINNGVDLEPRARSGDRGALCQQLGIGSSSTLIATVGRLTLQKGHYYLIEAAVPVVERFPDTHLLVVGEGELRHSLACQAEQSGLAGHVHFLGVREDMANLLAAVDLFVLPSLWEGLSLALLEAMAAARPVVATAVSGTVQAMIPGVTGLVVPPGDSQALADAMVQLLSDPAQAQAMGQAARKRVESAFSAPKQAAEHLALYHHSLHPEGKP